MTSYYRVYYLFMKNIPYTDFGGKGEILLFVHANGFPPMCYKSLLDQWTPHYRVIGIHLRPLWEDSDFRSFRSWTTLSKDLLLFIKKQGWGKVYCVSHSLGGVVSIHAAYHEPTYFKHLILLEPVLFTRLIPTLTRLFPPRISRDIIPISRIALKRKAIWESKEEMFKTYREKKIFEKIEDKVLRQMVEGFLEKTPEGKFQLIYSRDWEAQIYSTVMYIVNKINKSTVPISIAKGAHTEVINNKTWIKLQNHIPQERLRTFENTSHLLPFESQEVLSLWVLQQLSAT